MKSGAVRRAGGFKLDRRLKGVNAKPNFRPIWIEFRQEPKVFKVVPEAGSTQKDV